ncbi:MAG TPA: hypothetical protein VF761_15000 [Gemmatimonadaceae bacterium]
MKISIRFAAIAGMAALTAACTYVRSTPLAAARYPVVPADSVRFFATNPPAKYVEIAMMRVEGLLSSDSRSAKALREKAGKMGANGIILLNARGVTTRGGGTNVGVIIAGGRHDGSAVIVGDGDDGDVKEFERAVAIRYEPEAAVAQGSASPSPR